MQPKRPIDRLLEYLEFKGKTPFKAENELGISNGYIRNAEKRDGGIGSLILEKIFAIYLDLNLTWLITGIGEMLVSDKMLAVTPNGNNLLSDHNLQYNTSTPTTSKATKTTNIRKLDPPTDPPTAILSPLIITVDRNGQENILHVPVRARAGYLTGYGDPEFMETLPSFNLPGLVSGTYRSFEVEGDSMYPTLKNRQMVIGQWVEKLDYIREDRVYVLVTQNDGIIIKRLLNRIEKHGIIIAKSDAIDERNLYPNIPVKPEDIKEIWYAVWHGGFDFQSPSDTWRRINNHEADITVLQNTVSQLLNVIKSAGLLNSNGTDTF